MVIGRERAQFAYVNCLLYNKNLVVKITFKAVMSPSISSSFALIRVYAATVAADTAALAAAAADAPSPPTESSRAPCSPSINVALPRLWRRDL